MEETTTSNLVALKAVHAAGLAIAELEPESGSESELIRRALDALPAWYGWDGALSGGIDQPISMLELGGIIEARRLINEAMADHMLAMDEPPPQCGRIAIASLDAALIALGIIPRVNRPIEVSV